MTTKESRDDAPENPNTTVSNEAMETITDFEAMKFCRDQALVADPYPYFDALRGQCPVRREPHHDVTMVTGYDEAVEVLHDSTTFSSCISVTGPWRSRSNAGS